MFQFLPEASSELVNIHGSKHELTFNISVVNRD
jgi:hypothetical protein